LSTTSSNERSSKVIVPPLIRRRAAYQSGIHLNSQYDNRYRGFLMRFERKEAGSKRADFGEVLNVGEYKWSAWIRESEAGEILFVGGHTGRGQAASRRAAPRRSTLKRLS
jgi:hypothetical protein